MFCNVIETRRHPAFALNKRTPVGQYHPPWKSQITTLNVLATGQSPAYSKGLMSDLPTNDSSAPLDAVPKSYETAVRILAAAHASGDDPVEIYHVPDSQQHVVRLIEVSPAFPEGGVERPAPSAGGQGGMERVVPVFPLGPAKDFPFRSEIAQVTPAEWMQLRQGSLKLNRDWGDLNRAQRVPHGN